MRFSTWNNRTLHQAGKYENVWREMRRMRIDVMGVDEVRWPGVGELES